LKHDKIPDNTSLLNDEFSGSASYSSNQPSLRHYEFNDKADAGI